MNRQIVCMVRSGIPGRATQDQAIAHSRETGKQLVFLHINHTEAFSQERPELKQAFQEELTWLARITLNQARQRAERRGVKAEVALRNGTFFETVLAYVKAHPTDRLYVGRPREDIDHYAERLSMVQSFAERLMQEVKLEVILV
jgi:nucleotide-binding universal stress UspA family protein